MTNPRFSSVCSQVSRALFLPFACNDGESRQSCTGPLSSSPRKPPVVSSRRHEGPDSLGSSSSGTSVGSSTSDSDQSRLVFSASYSDASLASSGVVGPIKSSNAVGCSVASVLTGSETVGESTKRSSPITIGSGVLGRLNDNPPSGEPTFSVGGGSTTETGGGVNDKTSADLRGVAAGVLSLPPLPSETPARCSADFTITIKGSGGTNGFFNTPSAPTRCASCSSSGSNAPTNKITGMCFSEGSSLTY